MKRILLVQDAALVPCEIPKTLMARGYEVEIWNAPNTRLDPLAETPPEMVILAMDEIDTGHLAMAQALRHEKALKAVPVLAIIPPVKIGTAEKLLKMGIDDYLPRPFQPAQLTLKIGKLLRGDQPENEMRVIPDALREAFSRILEEARHLGDMAEVFPGATPRSRSYRRQAPPGPGWKGVIIDEAVKPFYVGREREFVKWSPDALARMPHDEEWDQREKVVMKRAESPVAAAVDTSRCPVAAELFAIVPARGLDCSFLACLLNSRLIDFYLHRIRPPREDLAGVYLRRPDIEAIPVIVPEASEQKRFAPMAKRRGTLEALHGGRRASKQMCGTMNEAIFDVYGLGPEAREELKGLHF